MPPLRHRIVPALVVLFALLAIAPTTLARQEPAVDPGLAFPAYLQQGSCAEPGTPMAALAESATRAARPSDSPVTAGDGLDSPPAVVAAMMPAAVSVTDVDRPLAELLAEPLIVRVVADADLPDEDVACGVVAGEPDEDGNVYLGLAETNDSGVWGIAWLQSTGERTTVTLFLIDVPTTDGASGPDDSAD